MDEPRLRAKLRVQAMLRAAQVGGAFGAVLRRGDADAGGIVVVLRAPAGLVALTEMRTGEGEAAWLRGAGPVDQPTLDADLARRTRVDPDLWVVEFEGAELRLPFEGRVVEPG